MVGGRRALCQLIGGYGRKPLDESSLSPESLERARRDGPCLTVAQVPAVRDGSVEYEVVKIFNQPVLHERETVGWAMDMLVPRSGGER